MTTNNKIKNLDELALETLRDVCLDDEAPAAARAGAARTILEAVGRLKGGASAEAQSKSMTEMTAAELDAMIRKLESKG